MSAHAASFAYTMLNDGSMTATRSDSPCANCLIASIRAVMTESVGADSLKGAEPDKAISFLEGAYDQLLPVIR